MVLYGMVCHELILYPEDLEVNWRVRTLLAELSDYHCINLYTDINLLEIIVRIRI